MMGWGIDIGVQEPHASTHHQLNVVEVALCNISQQQHALQAWAAATSSDQKHQQQ
jgi:hypothetical protein